MREFETLLKKDFFIEMRTGYQFLPFVTVSILLASFLGLGASSFVSDRALLAFLFHPLAWSIFLLSGAMTLIRVFESDREASTVRVLRVLNRSMTSYYLAKIIFLSVLFTVNHLIASFFLAGFLQVSLSNWIWSYLAITLIVSLSYSALGAFLGGFISQHSHRHILQPLVFLPLLFPLFFAVLEVSGSIAAGTGLLGAGNWLSLIVGLGTLYLLVGINLFDAVVRE